MNSVVGWAESLIRQAHRVARLTAQEIRDRSQKVKSLVDKAESSGWKIEDEFSGSYGRAHHTPGLEPHEDQPVLSRDFSPGRGRGWSKDQYQEMWRQVRAYAQAHNIDSLPRDRLGVVLGGGSGTGKTSLRKTLEHPIYGKITPDRFGIVDPDDFKEWGWKNGMYDHLRERMPGLTEGEMANLIHEHSSAMAKMYQLMLLQRGANIVIDKTFMGVDDDGKPLPLERNPAMKAINQLVKAGYESPGGILVDAPPEFSEASATNRYNENVDRSFIAASGMYPDHSGPMSLPNTPENRKKIEEARQAAALGARLIGEDYLIGQGRSPDPTYLGSPAYNFAQAMPYMGSTYVATPKHEPPGYSNPQPDYVPPDNFYGYRQNPNPLPIPEDIFPRVPKTAFRHRLGMGIDGPPQDYGEACDWFRRGQIDFDTLHFALLTLPPPDDLPWGRNEGERRRNIDIACSGLDTDCIEELYAGDLIDLDQLCALWEAVYENPNTDVDPDAELGF